MIRKAKRLPQAVFTGRPMRRLNFAYGTLALFDGPRGAFAIIVSKRVARLAVDRNRIRRRMSHLLKEFSASLRGAVALYPNARVRTAPIAAIRDALGAALGSR